MSIRELPSEANVPGRSEYRDRFQRDQSQCLYWQVSIWTVKGLSDVGFVEEEGLFVESEASLQTCVYFTAKIHASSKYGRAQFSEPDRKRLV